MNDDAVRFWQPSPHAAAELACAYFQAGQTRPHVHEEWQFAVPEIPSKLSVGAFRRYAADSTDITVVAPYEVHTEGVDMGPATHWWVLFVAPSIFAPIHRGVTGSATREIPRFTGPVLADPAWALELRALLRDSEEGKIEGSQFVTRVVSWLEQLLRRHRADGASPARMPAVERAQVYLRDRATQTVSMPEVGAVAGVTVSHLVRSFSRAVGLPPMSYHTQVRLARARRLLAEGKSATWVAYECRFGDQSHLSRRFKQCYGLTPGAFQSQYRKGVDSNAA